MTPKSKSKKSDAQLQRDLKRLLRQIEVQRVQAQKQGRAFLGLSEEQLIRKLRGETSNSPFIFAQEWDQFADSGSPAYFVLNYHNPDPIPHLCFVTIFFGLAHLDPNISSAIAARDTRWPYVSTELVFLEPGATGVAYFEYTVPYATKGTYFGNPVLWEWQPFDQVGTLFDRGGPFYVTLK